MGPTFSRRLGLRPALLALSVVVGVGASPVQAQTSGASGGPEPVLQGTFDVGGRSLYLRCEGSGGPVIVLDAGLGNGTSTWDPVLPGIGAIGRVCVYDRANISRSDAAPTPRTLVEAVRDLDALLSSAGVEPPYVLVGHSIGGLDVRLYAATYPTKVAGIVLVDGSPAELFDVDRACLLLSAQACEETRSMMGAMAANPEGLIPSMADLLTIQGSVPAIPARILAATEHEWEGVMGAEIEALADQAQADLAALWPRASLLVAEGSGHYIHEEQPALVVQAIEDVVLAARLDR
jgi:pimeloyl-ACP methyl ester carboxylesterase